MPAGPKNVAGRGERLAAQQAGADPLQAYCPDLDQWPRSWAGEARDIPPGLRMVEYFKPFLRDLLTRNLSRKTLRQHRDKSFDATCRKFFRFLTEPEISHGRARRSQEATNRLRH